MKKIIGITGGIASGKTNVCNVLKDLGYKIIDCDEIAFTLSKKGNILHREIIKYFKEDYLLENGEINRKKLAKTIFNDSEKRKKLDNITHPIIKEELLKRINTYKDEEYIFIEVPLLYESKFNLICDLVLCVYLEKPLQIERLMSREGISYEYAKAKVESQMDLALKGEMADYVIISSGSFDDTKNQIIRFITRLKEGEI